jgi:Concanavalin A-like lectin/glucanases superfamily
MTTRAKFCVIGLATAFACSYDASQLAGPPTGGMDASFPAIDGAQARNDGTGGLSAIDAPSATGGFGGTSGVPSSGTASGGAIGSGGAPGAGGTVASGGWVGTGGVVGKGGVTGTGVSTGTGGKTGSGGVVGTGGVTTPDAGPDLPVDFPSDTATGSTLISGLLVYYKCESATGTTLPDSSGKDNNGTLVSASGATGYSFSTGKVGKALTLAKAGSGYVSMPPAVFASLTDITIATWVHLTTAQNWQHMFDIGVNAHLTNSTSTGTHYMNLVPQNGSTNLAFAISKDGYGAEQALTSTALAAGVWKHVAVVLSSGQGNLYVDGAVVSTSSALSLRPSDLGTIDYAYLGKSQFGADAMFDGAFDEFRVYSRALSAAEIQELYQFTGP